MRTLVVNLLVIIASILSGIGNVVLAQQSGEKFRLAIIGLIHSHAWGHLRNMVEIPGVELVAIAEPVADLQQEAKKYAPNAKYYEDYHKMLDEVKPEAVWAFVENNRHLEIVQVCAPKGIHCVFEKPLASTFSDAKKMAELAKKHNILLMTNYQMAWWPTNYAAYNAAKEGKIGDVWRIHAIIGHGGPGKPLAPGQKKGPGDYFFAWLNDSVGNGGGAIIDFGCYGSLWTCWYLGKPEVVQAMVNLRNPNRYKVDDNAVILCSYPKGVAILEGSWSLPRGFQDLEVFGDKGSINITGQGAKIQIGRDQAQELSVPALPESYKSPITYLASCARQNKPLEGLVAPEINLDVCEILEAAKLSISTGKKITLPLSQ